MYIYMIKYVYSIITSAPVIVNEVATL